jgi:hypothetical protein
MTDQHFELLKLVADHPSCTCLELNRILDILVSDSLSPVRGFRLVITRWPMYENTTDRQLKKIPPIKAIRELTRMGLKEAKEFIEEKYQGENTPVTLMYNLSLEDADKAEEAFRAAGCDTSIQLDR